MFAGIAKKMFGSKNERYLKTVWPLVETITGYEPQMQQLHDEDFPAKINEWREEVAHGRSIEELLPEVFALVREASQRALQMRHFDVQLLGGIILHKGRIAEMKTGEGKTLVATLPLVLNALNGKGAHLITVNDYLAKRDAEWMGRLYNFLGMSVGSIMHGMDEESRKAAYAADITYGTNNEFGFDYLRDHMKFYADQLVQRELHFAIVDEVDSILIDEARTPLIISGPAEDSTAMYKRINTIVPQLKRDRDFNVDEKAKTVTFSEDGVARCEQILGLENLFDAQNIHYQHHILQALKAHELFTRDDDYIVKDGQVIIVDEFTGRLMPGRRFSDGLHQALEAKEGVKVEAENQTLAQITFQNFFRMYDKLSGMTGTADTEAVEFNQIYNLDVSVIPTHKPMVREDHADMVYRTQKEKYEAIAEEIHELYTKGQPVLVGTTSIDKSELISELLKKRKVQHNVLNAKHHEQEAEIVASAGQRGKVTIATNMAGRGTDIVLGDGVRELGGLHILGTERHESRRIDNQLRGRSGRQGDPGESEFFLSLEDDLMRIFGSERMDSMLERLGIQEGEAITHKWVNKALEKAQSKVEARNFDIRKNLLKFDDVMNDQRKVIYDQRKELMASEDVHDTVVDMRYQTIDDMIARYVPEKAYPEQWELDSLHEECMRVLALDLPVHDWAKEEGIADSEIRERVVKASDRHMAEKAANYGPAIMRQAEKQIVLHTLDKKWKEHLLTLDHLRHGIGLRAFAQRNPLNEYQQEAFDLFQQMLAAVREAGISIRDVKTEQADLQDVFLDLTRSR